MKKTISIILALIMLFCAAPITAYADWPMANSLTATNAIDGVCRGTVELSWTPSSTPSDYNHQICITKSLDGTNFTKVATLTNKVSTTKTYTYNCMKEDLGKTVYFGVQYESNGSSTLYDSHRRSISVRVEAPDLGYDEEECYRLLMEGLANPAISKKTENYDGYNFVKGTKATWKCKLYTLTAKVTSVSGKKATFTFTFDSKIPLAYLGENAYSINVGTKTFYPGDTMKYTVDTSKSDGAFDTNKEGMQFMRIRVEREQVFDPIVYSNDSYFADIVANRRVYPENAIYFSRVYVEDLCALGYYVKPDASISKSSFSVTKDTINLGSIGYTTTIKYRVKGAKSWKEKNFKKNKAMKLTKLKANTVYEIHMLCKIAYTDPETGKTLYTVDQLADPFKLTTVITSKPKVTSIKISKAKFGKQTINGYWESDGDWHPTETFNKATYTITVKVKSVPKNAKGLRMKTGGAVYYAKGNKKTYTFKVSYRDKKAVKGKKISTSFSWSSNSVGSSPLGIGPGKSASYKIKNGTYKVK